ncbi:MAG: hypothetical protein ABEJ55_02065 [Halanaeroarchaeum sp.]
MTESEHDFEKETVIGHRVTANIEESSLAEELERAAESVDINTERLPLVEITVDDVDWKTTESVHIRLDTLNDMVEALNEIEMAEE